MTPEEAEHAKTKDMSRLTLDGRIYLCDPESDTTGMERLTINGKVYFRSIAEEKLIKAEEEAEKRAKYKNHLKVMIYSVHNLPPSQKVYIVMTHGKRVVNVGTLRGNRPKWNQAIRFKNAEFTGNVTFRLHGERG
jgi:hypothetical protein